MKISEMVHHIHEAWSPRTSYKDSWSAFNPARGQCAVTALLVQHELGGDIIRAELSNGETHYYNRLNNIVIDLTDQQYKQGYKIVTESVADRQILLSNADTIERYVILYDRYVQSVEGKL